MRVAVIGTGGMGARHVENLHDHVKRASVTVLVDPDRARVGALASRIGARVETDAVAAITADDVDAVVIASPDHTHAELALACVAAGKPALVEKPLGVTEAEARSVVDAEVAAGRRIVQVGLMRHFDRQHRDVEHVVRSGGIGRPLLFRGWHRNPPDDPPPSTRQIVVNAAVHDLYSARWLLGSEPVRVFAAGVPVDPSRNTARELQLATLEMANDSIAVIEVNKDSGFGYEVGVEVVGTDGTVTIAPHHTPTLRRGDVMAQRIEPDWLERFADAYVAEVRAWVHAVATETHVGPSAWDGYATLVTAEAIVRSIETGEAIAVDVGERPDLYV